MWNRPIRFWTPLRDKDLLLLRSADDMKYSDPRLLSQKPLWLKQTHSDLERHEGFRKYAYPDPRSKLAKVKARWGFEPGDVILARLGLNERDGRPWTNGFGFTRGVTPASVIEKVAADRKLESEIIDHVKDLHKIAPGWEKLPLFASTVLTNMIFNMGLEKYSKFAPTINLIMSGRYAEAAARLRKTPWFSQVGSKPGQRGHELVTRLEKQRIEPVHLYTN